MRFWKENQEAYEISRENLVSPEIGMQDFVGWVEAFGGQPVFVGYPAAVDFAFVYWYLVRFIGRSPFSYLALDVKSYAMAKLGTSFYRTKKAAMPAAWIPARRRKHIALEDAIGQGELFTKMMGAAPEADRG